MATFLADLQRQRLGLSRDFPFLTFVSGVPSADPVIVRRSAATSAGEDLSEHGTELLGIEERVEERVIDCARYSTPRT
jgi:hypothetical protein